LFLIATLAIGAAVVSAQDPAIVSNKQPSGPLVKLSMIVTDHDNHSIDEIRKEDVRVAENGIEQTIALLEPDKRPIDYGLVIDSSGSFKSVLGSALEAAKLIVNGKSCIR